MTAPISLLAAAAYRCRAAYHAPPPGVELFAAGSDAGYLLPDPASRTLHIVLAGSDDAADWRRNLQVCPRRLWGAWVHRGIANAAERLDAPVTAAVLARVGWRLSFEGHSRGGALAYHLARAWYSRGWRMECMTFGAPRSIARWSRPPLLPGWCVEGGRDPVPHLPRLAYRPCRELLSVYLPVPAGHAIADYCRSLEATDVATPLRAPPISR